MSTKREGNNSVKGTNFLLDDERTAQTILLKDGRRLGYAEFGVASGKPVFHFHGYPGSRLEGKLANGVAAKCGVRLIAIDRPGMGLSDFRPKRAMLDWPDDVTELADFLKIGRFAVEGISGGGPYAIACAYKIPGRLISVGVVSGVCPSWDAGAPWERPRSIEDVENFWKSFSQMMPGPDKKQILDAKIMRVLAEEVFEAFNQGFEGVEQERKLYGKPWGFRLEDISSKVEIYLWHGKLDVNVPFSASQAVARAIPNCKAVFYAREGHYSTALNHLGEIFRTLISWQTVPGNAPPTRTEMRKFNNFR
jgi:pimeloyl-ACP methyl ester carboxylesterase